jgi:hypothetical protein
MDGIGLYRKGLGIKFWINLAEIFVCCNFVKPVVWTLHHKSIVIGMEEGGKLFPVIEKYYPFAGFSGLSCCNYLLCLWVY